MTRALLPILVCLTLACGGFEPPDLASPHHYADENVGFDLPGNWDARSIAPSGDASSCVEINGSATVAWVQLHGETPDPKAVVEAHVETMREFNEGLGDTEAVDCTVEPPCYRVRLPIEALGETIEAQVEATVHGNASVAWFVTSDEAPTDAGGVALIRRSLTSSVP